MPKVYIGLGSNIGRPIDNLSMAIKMLAQSEEVRITGVSSVYLTEPVGYEDQAWFHNAVAQIETSLSPEALLQLLQEIEIRLGRVRNIRWGPRTVDLDILCYSDQIISTDNLQVPHPRMLERAFVLAPLAEIAGDMLLCNGLTVNKTLKELSDCKKFVCIQQKIW